MIIAEGQRRWQVRLGRSATLGSPNHRTIFQRRAFLPRSFISAPVRLREKMVRFYLPDVLQELREKAKTSKRNVARKLLAGGANTTEAQSANDTN